MPKVLVDVLKDSPLGSAWLKRLELQRGQGVLITWAEENDQFTVKLVAVDDPGIAGLSPTSMEATGVGE